MNNLKNEIKNDLENKLDVDLNFDTSKLQPNKKSHKLAITLTCLAILTPLVILSIPFLSMIDFKPKSSLIKRNFTINEKQVMESTSFKKLNEINYPSLETKNLSISDEFKEAINNFSNEMYKRSFKEDNYSFSPMSLYYLMNNISLSSTKEEINNEFDNLLKLDKNKRKEDLIKTYKNNYFCNEQGTIQMYNSVFLSNDFQYNEEYINLLKDYYIEAYQLSFKNDQDKIIEWIDNKINQKDFMKKEELEIDDNDTVIYFINTLYFNNRWYHIFNDENNYIDTFYSNNSNEKVTYMNHSYIGEINEQDKFYEVTDYYKNNIKIKYYISKNDEDIFSLTKDINLFNLDQTTKKEAYINLSLPKFSNNYSLDFTEILKEMMPNTFDENANSLNNIFNDENLGVYLQLVKQKNEITFFEDGTMIKSVSYGAGNKAESTLDGYNIQLNKPFIYIIYDVNDVPIYVGNMVNPNK